MNVRMPSSPRSHAAGVPSGMDVNTPDAYDLLSASGAVEVVLTENDTKRPTAAIFLNKEPKRNTILLTING